MSFKVGLFVNALLWATAVGTSGSEDVRDGYLFLFHDENDLILAIKDDNCYFVSISELQMNSTALRSHLADEIVKGLNGSRPAEVTLSSENEVHNKFQDIVADIMCRGKQLYDVLVLATCVYKNNEYLAGERWKDDCGNDCRCKHNGSRIQPQCTGKSGFHVDLCDVSDLSPESDCRDKIDNCDQYGQSACSGPYETWAREHCPLFCQYCSSGMTTVPPPCEDALPNCRFYQDDICTNSAYAGWSDANCRKFCNMCDKTTVTSTVWTTPESGCYDAISYCDQYGSDVCIEPSYRVWVADNCQKFCGVCTVTGQAGPVSTTPEPCADELDNCPLYGQAACGGIYVAWAKRNCRNFCNLCDETTTEAADQTTTTTTTQTGCVDKADNCQAYPQTYCQGDYLPWAADNCRARCGLCDV